MSTEYYRFKDPITSINIVKHDTYDQVSIWISHNSVGFIIIKHEDLSNFIHLLREDESIAYHYCGGRVIRRQLMIKQNLHPETYIISEYNEVLQFRDLK